MKKDIASNVKNDAIIKEAVDQLLGMFKTGTLPEKVAFSIIHRHAGDVIPSDAWSIGNRVLQMLQGTCDARGYKQWADAGRHVKKGSHAIHILAPLTFKIREKDEKTGEEVEKVIVKGYRPIPGGRHGRGIPRVRSLVRAGDASDVLRCRREARHRRELRAAPRELPR